MEPARPDPPALCTLHRLDLAPRGLESRMHPKVEVCLSTPWGHTWHFSSTVLLEQIDLQAQTGSLPFSLPRLVSAQPLLAPPPGAWGTGFPAPCLPTLHSAHFLPPLHCPCLGTRHFSLPQPSTRPSCLSGIPILKHAPDLTTVLLKPVRVSQCFQGKGGLRVVACKDTRVCRAHASYLRAFALAMPPAPNVLSVDILVAVTLFHSGLCPIVTSPERPSPATLCFPLLSTTPETTAHHYTLI